LFSAENLTVHYNVPPEYYKRDLWKNNLHHTPAKNKFVCFASFAVLMKSSIKTTCICAFFLTSITLFAQKDDNYLYWSATRKLTANDFVIKTNNSGAGTCFAQFYFSYEVNGFDFMTKNFNNKVHNCIIRSASWIDTAYDVKVSLRYQQTLFDLAEVYARHFRRDLKENRKKILKGTDFIKELNAKSMTDFSKRRIEYDSDTQSGTNAIMQQRWEQQIQMELDQLKEFAIEEK
jgi:hypothetical protein